VFGKEQVNLRKRALLHFFEIGCYIAITVVFTGCTTVVKTVMFRHPKAKSVFNAPPAPNYTVTGEAWIDHAGSTTNTIVVLHVRANDHYSQGYYHGKLLGTNVKASIEDVLRGAEKLIPKGVRTFLTARGKRNLVESILDKAWVLMEPHTPRQDLDEMQGLAQGLKAAGVTGVDIKTIHRVHAIPDLGETSCSALVACASATADGHVYQMRILDYGGEFNLQQRPLITVYHPTTKGENAYINIGWIGFVGLVSGMNEKGVAISEMGYGNPPGETLEGTPMPFLLKQILRYANNANEAAAIVRGARRNNSYAYWLGDPEGHAIGMLTSARECAAFKINEQDTISHGKYTIPQYKDAIYGGHYNEKQGKVVKRMRGTFNVFAIQEMAREIAMKSNLHTVIHDLTTKDVWVANRHGTKRAADCVYVLFPYSAWEKQ
jgi:isopenicillin-N N-acyltransferase-like protein